MSDEGRRQLDQWAREKLDASRRRHGAPPTDVARIIKVAFDYDSGCSLSDQPCDGTFMYVLITWVGSDGEEDWTQVWSEPDDVAADMGRLFTELLTSGED